MNDAPVTRNTPLLIHVGYHKTGTTWFQLILFQARFGFRQIMTHDEVFDLLVRPHGLVFDCSTARALVASRRGQGKAGEADVISSEILCGNPFYGGRESDLYAERLKAVAPDAKILITIREQTRALTSTYMQYLLRSGTQRPDSFFADAPLPGYYGATPEHFEYHRLVRRYADLFGTENIYVATQEALARDPHALASDLARFSGVTVEEGLEQLPDQRVASSYPEYCAPLLRRINYFRRGPMGHGLGFGAASTFAYRAMGALARVSVAAAVGRKVKPVSRYVSRRFAGRFVDSNRELKAILGDRVDLTGYQI